MHTIFLSDLHLDPRRPEATNTFLRFIAEASQELDALYILGDLFEVWIGDDALTPMAEAVADGLRTLADRAIRLYFLPGNRDFLVGPAYAARAGFELLPDPCVISLYGQDTLLLHGDTLCTDDVGYQALRRSLRDPAFQDAFLARTPAERLHLAQQARMQSQTRQSELKQSSRDDFDVITDVSAVTVNAVFAEFGVTRMIHGHTHRPCIHSHCINGQPCVRVVLGDWYQQGSFCVVDHHDLALQTLPFATAKPAR